ncbi:MAG TPA: 2Fe-2S iron-sulfur cluster-binding protein [Acidimicrobiales bacterium]|nr:2Fe-2S iron-sulfur cluster-binding protein [Acidimicrobiales bacterium]
MPDVTRPPLQFEVDGMQVEVPDDGTNLLVALRELLGARSPKDGCSPQGQCGCCTVLVDGQPRVACVTPARRVRGRTITTLDGLDADRRQAWGDAFCATGASQCGFCTPGIVLRLEALRAKGADLTDPAPVEQALLAHLCRCTGWRTILDAAALGGAAAPGGHARDLDAASRRATIEGRAPQRVAPEVALGRGGFADDLAPHDALVAVPDGAGGWAVGDTLAEARAASGKVQGRRTTAELTHPVAVPEGDWAVTLQTTWVEPAYLEVDASWCVPGGEPATPLANGGAFGGKADAAVAAAARALADEHDRPVRVVLSREDAVRRGPKRPPLAAGVRADGTGVVRVVRSPGFAQAIVAVAPGLVIEEVDVPGPPTSCAPRATGWAEAIALLAAVHGAGAPGRSDRPGVAAAERSDGRAAVTVCSPEGAVATAEVALGDAPRVSVRVTCGDPLDEIVVRSYAVGATHMALGWVTSEGLAVDGAGEVHDLTIRSFGVLRAVDTPPIDVTVEPADGPPVNGSDAVFAAVAAATWLAQGTPPAWPTGTPVRRR